MSVLSWVDILRVADVMLYIVGTLVLVVAARRLHQRGDPLREAPLRPNRLPPEAIIVAVLIYFASFAAVAALMGIPLDTTAPAPLRVIATTIGQVVGIATCLVVGTQFFDGGWRGLVGPRGSLRKNALTIVAACAIALGFCPLLLEASEALIHVILPKYQFTPHSTFSLLREQQPTWIMAGLWLGAVLGAPLAEELFFRGLLQTLLIQTLRSRWAAIGGATICFALVHLQQAYALVPLLALSALLGFLYEYSGSLVPPVVVHAAFNLKMLVWDALISRTNTDG